MADFYKALEETMKHEGGYAFEPDDAGGETYRGISRWFNQSWHGWQTIDRYKREGVLFPANLAADEQLQIEVREFYRQEHWDKIKGESISNQAVADTLFDASVNLGWHRASVFLQHSLNLLNRNGRAYPELVEDGRIGPKTLNVLETYFESSSESYLVKAIVILRGNHHFQYMRKSPVQEKFARSWLNRLSFKTT